MQPNVSGARAILAITSKSFPPTKFLQHRKEYVLSLELGRIRQEPPCLYLAQSPQSPQVQTLMQEAKLAQHKFTHKA
jgi:hypothetical protein